MAAGMTNADAARAVGVSVDRISTWLKNDPAFVERLDKAKAMVQQNVQEMMKQLGPTAVATLHEAMMEAPNYSDRVRAATEILDRIGFVKGSTHSVEINDYRKAVEATIVQIVGSDDD